jgi:CHAT domain-containing protein/Flp pilus assembly protein TadD
VDYYERSLAIFRSLKDPGGESKCLNNLGVVYEFWGQYDKAVKYYEQSLAIFRSLKDPAGEANTLNNLGIVYMFRGQYDKAVDYYERSLAIKRSLKDPAGEAMCLNNLGIVYKSWGQYDKAVDYYEQSLAIRRSLKDPAGESNCLNNLGNVYNSWGQFDKAMKNFQSSLTISRNLKDKSGEAHSLSAMGITYAQMGQFEEALKHLQEANTINAEIGVTTAGEKHNIGNVYLDLGELDKAEPLIVDAGYNVSLGRLSLLKQDYPKAAEYYEKVRTSAEKNRNSDNLFTSYTGLGLAYENLNDNKAAEENYRKAVDLTEEVRSSLTRDQREKFFDVRINGFLRTAPYDGLARVRLKMGKTEDALKVSEYTKARIFAESMSKRSDNSDFDIKPEIKKQDEDLNNRLSALKKTRQEAYEKGDKLKIEALEPQVKDLESKLQAHIKMLREKYPVFAATKYPQPMDLEQTALKDNEWVLEYHVTDPGIIIYLSKGKQLIKALFKPKPREDLEKLVLEYRKPLEVDPRKDKLEEKLASFSLAMSKELSDLLLADVLADVPEKASIIIVPDDCLGTVPFEMLTLNAGGSVKTDKPIPYISGAEFFGDRNLISYYQSVTALTLARNHSKEKSAKGGLLAIADPVFSEKDDRKSKAPRKEAPTGALASLFKSWGLMGAEGDQMGGLKFPRLELTENLADALVKNDKKGSYLCKGFEATKDNFLQNIKPSLKKYDKIIFATHGYFGKDLPGIMEPVLVLTLVPPGTDGFLRMTEVMGLDMNAEIVALTACQTGLGKRTAGEGTMGMGRAFQYAGAKSVLMSLWSVSEVASVKLVKSFFEHIKAGKSKPEALELARSELRKGVFDHPFFWAGFILVGETN